MLDNAWVIPALPVLSFVLILFFGKRLPKGGHEIGVTAVAIAFVLACVCAVQWVQRPADLEVKPKSEEHAAGPGSPAHANAVAAIEEKAPPGGEGGHEGESKKEKGAGEHEVEPIRKPVVKEVTWFDNGQTRVKAGTHVDGLTVTMLFVVTLISLLVHVFSTSYMSGDRRYTHYFAALSLFTAGMLVMVTANNTLQLLVGWELMGVCSFMLIGHWWEEQNNSNAALKAFFTTRTGDVGLLIGIAILFFAAGQTFDIAETNAQALGGEVSHGLVLAGAAALLCGVVGKSAQFPLHTWLPDAMAGPTPVSALIHAATMVVAGVYLVARLYGVFWSGFDIGGGGINPVALVGGITVLIAAALAFVQSDIKKVLAYSTVSQLGYMVMALGVGAWTAGVFHLVTHAFFKGLLFLGAGSVSHAVHSFDMKKDMGGLRQHMPITFKTFVIGSLALAGVPPLAGFWSKDEILLGASSNGYPLFLVVGLIGAGLTAAYMTRCVYLTFFGEYRGHGHPHESPPAITVPLVVLAGLSVVAGFVNVPGGEWFAKWTENETVLSAGVAHHSFSIGVAALGSALGLAGITAGYAYYWRNLGPHRLTQSSGAARTGYRILEEKYGLDRLYTNGVVGAIKGPIARGAYWFNQRVIDGVVNGVGIVARGIARFVYDTVDQKGIDGLVNGAGIGAEDGGKVLRLMQTGRVQQYALFLFGAVVVLGGTLVLFTTG
ncbi:MAG TPA: NADH-quinone oxidoreductase subunit L [Acidimicrobiales bacterium]|nr:NADH-quinone oxidoreductase subunit L [Acidimicrobiales bacterium]